MQDAPESPVASAEPTARIDELAPLFVARSTLGEVQLSDYRGRWVIFFSHPADFTPVCHLRICRSAKRKRTVFGAWLRPDRPVR